jgi:quercetin dioxygenase-like cupin family protein
LVRRLGAWALTLVRLTDTLRAMKIRDIVFLVFLTAVGLLPSVPAAGQSPDPGVTPVRLMDRSEIRISRVDVQPGAVRSVHTHDDVKFHVWLALTGRLELTIGSAKPVLAAEGQAFFMQKGTPHGFRNVGTTPATVMEIFVKEGAVSTADIGALLAALGTRSIHEDRGQAR